MSGLYLSLIGLVILNPVITKKGYKFYLFMFLCVLVYYAYHFDVTTGADLYRRYQEMELYNKMGLDYVLENRMEINPLSALFFYWFSTFEDPQLVPAFTILVCYGSAFYILIKCSERYDLSKNQMNFLLFIFMLTFYYDQAISNVRVYICYGLISLFLYKDVIEGKFRRLAWVVYIACCFFHYAVLPFVILRGVLYIKDRVKGTDTVLYLSIAVCCVFGDMIIPYLAKFGGIFLTLAYKSSGYENYSVFGLWQSISSLFRMILLPAMCFFINRFYNDKYSQEKKLMFYLVSVSIMLFFMISNYQLIFRTPNFMQYLAMVPISVLLKMNEEQKNQANIHLYSALKIGLIIMAAYTFAYQAVFIHPNVNFVF